MFKIPINSIGKTFSINKIEDGKYSFNFEKSNEVLFENTVSTRKKKQFYKRTTLLSLFAIKEALNSAGIDINCFDRNRIGLCSFEKESNHFCIEDTYKKLIKLCQQEKMSNNTFSETIARCYSLSDIFRLMPNLSNHLISCELGINGANKTYITGEGTDLQSIIDACTNIHDNKYDMVICGSSALSYSLLENKQMAEFYNYDLQEEITTESAVYIILGKEKGKSTLYLRGGKSFYIKNNSNYFEKKDYLNGLFKDFFDKYDLKSQKDIDLILYVDQYKRSSTISELEILKEIFTDSNIVMPELYHNICNGLIYLSLLYNNIYNFNNVLLFQKNYNDIITFIYLTK